MSERKKLELQLNQPTQIELLYDEPVCGNNQYGAYYLYAVKSGNEEFSYFAPEAIHEKIKTLRRGDTATITKTAVQQGNKIVIRYEVEVKVPEMAEASAGNNGKYNGNGKHNGNGHNSEEMIARAPDNKDNLFAIMLQCYRDAFQIQQELNGLIDPEKVAITLFIARSRTNGGLYDSRS